MKTRPNSKIVAQPRKSFAVNFMVADIGQEGTTLPISIANLYYEKRNFRRQWLHDRQGAEQLRRTLQAGEYLTVQHHERRPFRRLPPELVKLMTQNRVFSRNEARDRDVPTNANQIRLQASRVRLEHRPIRYQLPARLSFRQGQDSTLDAPR
jgi:hypothetical protein